MTRLRSAVAFVLTAVLAIPLWLVAIAFALPGRGIKRRHRVRHHRPRARRRRSRHPRCLRDHRRRTERQSCRCPTSTGWPPTSRSAPTPCRAERPCRSTGSFRRYTSRTRATSRSGSTSRARSRSSSCKADSHIPPSHVTQLRLHSIVGNRVKVDPRIGKTLHLLSRKIHYVHGELQAQPVTWAVEGTKADPGISVTTSEPRFDPVRATQVDRAADSGCRHRPGGHRAAHSGRPVRHRRNLADDRPQRHRRSPGVGPELREGRTDAWHRPAPVTSRFRRCASARSNPLSPTSAASSRRSTSAAASPCASSTRTTAQCPRPAVNEVTLTAGSAMVTSLIGTELSVPALLLSRVAERIGSGWGSRSVTYSWVPCASTAQMRCSPDDNGSHRSTVESGRSI